MGHPGERARRHRLPARREGPLARLGRLGCAAGEVGPYLRDLQALYDRYGLAGALYGHFGQGCVHSRISFDLRTADGLANYRSFMSEAADLVVSYGGSLSGEHGDGQQRAELLVKQYGEPLRPPCGNSSASGTRPGR